MSDSTYESSYEEDEYLILDIYDQNILDKANPLDGLAFVNFDSAQPTIIIGGEKYQSERIPVQQYPTFQNSELSKTTPTSPPQPITSAESNTTKPKEHNGGPIAIYHVDNRSEFNVQGIGHINHHLVLGTNRLQGVELESEKAQKYGHFTEPTPKR